MRSFLAIISVLLVLRGYSQFSGGNADGYAACVSSAFTMNDQAFYCQGGNSDGYSVNLPSVSTLNNQLDYCSGGDGDGYTTGFTDPSTINDQSFYCSAGPGDGYDADSAGGWIQYDAYFCNGGDGDGYATGYADLFTINNQSFYCDGGNGDGYATGVTDPFTANNQAFYCAGGNGDGYDEASCNIFTINNQLFYCSGGNADGYCADSSGTVDLGNAQYYCSGGDGDGYSMNTGSALFGNMEIYCSGGSGDGYHHLGSASVSFGNGIWRGITGDGWNTASNWANDIIPDETIDVVIPAGCSYYPVLPAGDSMTVNAASGTFRCKGILIKGEAGLTNLGALSVYGPFFVFGQYTANNNHDTSQTIGSGGTMTLGTGGLISIGNQSSTLGLCDLVIKNGGALALYGGSLYIDDQLNILAGGAINMSDGIIFAHRHGQGSDYSSAAPGSFYVSPGASGTITGGLIKVSGKDSNGSFSAVAIYSPAFDFSGTANLKMTDGTFASFHVAEIRTIDGADINKLTIDKPYRTVKIGTDAHIREDVTIMPASNLEIGTGKTVAIGE